MLKIKVGSAITVLNAIKSDYGAAIGIDIPISVIIESSTSTEIQTHPPHNPILIQCCVDIFRSQYNLNISNVKISSHSPIPSERGLKTSSAVSTATCEVINQYFQLNLSISDIINLSCQASINAGVSITGAYDDAYASFCGGLAFTRASNQELLNLNPIKTNENILLLIPINKNPKLEISKVLKDAELPDLQLVPDYIKRGDIIKAIKTNSQQYGPYLLQDPQELVELQRLDITVAGINGAGPSLFIIYNEKKSPKLRAELAETYNHYEIRQVSINQIMRTPDGYQNNRTISLSR